MRVAVGITGASGSIYAVNLIRSIAGQGGEVHGIISPMGEKVLMHECAMGKEEILPGMVWHDNGDLFAPISSGSYRLDAMAIAPCSMNTLAAVANGSADSLMTRAAGVCLKERRRLVLAIREMPLSIIHMEKMLEAAKAGAVILPACPGFYHDPRSMGDLINHVTGKIMDMLDIDNRLYARWGGA